MTANTIPYQSKHAADFKSLNLAWLEKYFFVEAKGENLLNDCETTILAIGGYIFLAENDNVIVGCFSFIPHKKGYFELGKMAVNQNYQGKGIGKQLLSYAIDFAKEQDWKGIILYSSTKLPAALHVYEKQGFKDVVLEKELPYARSDVKMELSLN